MIDLQKLILASCPPANPESWLPDAKSGIEYLLSQASGGETIIFARLECMWVQGLLVSEQKVSPPDHDELLGADIHSAATWSITYAESRDEPAKVYLAPPFDSLSGNSIEGAENLLVERFFHGVDKGRSRTEVSQKLIHALDLYWMDEESAYCRLDKNGDIEPVIRCIDLEALTSRAGDLVVTINARDLARYMVASNTVLFQKFDITRFVPQSFTAWRRGGERKTRGIDLVYNFVTQSNASYANGFLIIRPGISHGDLLEEFQSNWDDSSKQYASFKAFDWKNNRLDEISCAPDALASYFEKESTLPFQITPAFFKPEVLMKYKSDPEKYKLQTRSVSSRAGWHLQTYDINEAGQVHTYLRYLGDLPFEEQLYWKSFNEWPKAPISKRAFTTDIQGEWTVIPDPLVELIAEVRRLDEVKPDWWKSRGDDLREIVHYPVTKSTEEWSDSILALDQLLVEGFSTRAIRERLNRLDRSFDKEWGSLRLLQELFLARSEDAAAASDAVEPLRRLHNLRSKVKGHSSGSERQKLIKEARTGNGGLKEHFFQLVGDCQVSFLECRDLLETN